MPTSSSPRSPRPKVVVPLRAGKTRLAAELDPLRRADLRAAMLADVIAALRGAGLEEIVVAAGDDESADVATALDVEVHRDPPETDSLDAALEAATSQIPAERDVLIVTADLPGLTPSDVGLLLSSRGEVVIAPTWDGGTGALLRRPGRVMKTAYGVESAARHAAKAIDRGLVPTILDLPGFQVDIDTAADLAWLESAPELGPATRQWLEAVAAA